MTDNYYESPQTIEEPLANPRRPHSISVLLVIGLLYLVGLPGLAASVLCLCASAISCFFLLVRFEAEFSVSIWSLLIPFFFNLLLFAFFLSITKTARQMYRRDRKAKIGALLYIALCAVASYVVFVWWETNFALIPSAAFVIAFFIVMFGYTKSYCEPPKAREESPLVARIIDQESMP